MTTMYVISMVGLAGAATVAQYQFYKKNHPNGEAGKCHCKH